MRFLEFLKVLGLLLGGVAVVVGIAGAPVLVVYFFGSTGVLYLLGAAIVLLLVGTAWDLSKPI